MNNKKMNKKGFTILEISIVAVFASLLFVFFFIQKSDLDAFARDERRKTAEQNRPQHNARAPTSDVNAPQSIRSFHLKSPSSFVRRAGRPSSRPRACLFCL